MATDASSKTTRIVISAVIAIAIITAAVGLGVVAGGGDDDATAATTVTTPAPTTTAPAAGGDTTDPTVTDATDTTTAATTFEFVEFEGTDDILAQHAGKPLVVNFFASWCAPCRAELPDFADAHARYGTEVHFLGVDIQEVSREAAEELLRDTGIVFDVTEDPAAEIYADLGGIGAMPTTVFIDPAGEVSERAHGIIFADQLEDEIEALLG